MLRIFGDFESYYDQQYSLKKMSPIEYILNPQWETLGCAIAIEHEAPFLLQQDEVADFLRGINQPYCFISHNALFDACVLAFRYNIHPDALLCTLSIARAVLFHEIRNGKLSLANVLRHLDLGEKTGFIGNMSGIHWADLIANGDLMMTWTGYALNDVEGCRNIFFELRPLFPAREAMMLDRVIKMATLPRFQLDVDRLYAYRQDIIAQKQELLRRAMLKEPDVLASNAKFAKLLQEKGIDPPTKISPRTEKVTWAFSKQDHAFMELLEHDDLEVQALVAARVGIKTTIEETRSSRLINIGMCTADYLQQGPLLPVPLKFSGAHTHRLSGDWLLNLQNLSSRKNKEIRSSVLAPPGFILIAVDASQIEARLTAWLAQELLLLGMFARGEDTYRIFAAEIFRRLLEAVTKSERFVGKQCILGLGFGMSAEKLYHTIINLAREQGITDIEITIQLCAEWQAHYRRMFRRIPNCWEDLDWLLHQMMLGRADGFTFGPCVVEGTTIIMPGGLRLYYDNLRREGGEYFYDHGQFIKKIYGGKTLENVVQGLDRQYVMDAGMETEKIARHAGIEDPRMLLNIHDENIFCVPIEQALMMAIIALIEMSRVPTWGPDLPVAAEVKVGYNLGEMQEFKMHELEAASDIRDIFVHKGA
jgi:DNA polymerase family A